MSTTETYLEEKRRSRLHALTHVSPEMAEIVRQTFDASADKLPPMKAIKKNLSNILDNWDDLPDDKAINPSSFMQSYMVRELYLENCFVAYNHELLTAISDFCALNNIKSVSEILAGTGWFSHWMMKYGVPVKHVTDNKSWKPYKLQKNFLPMVKKMNAVQHVKRCRTVDMFVMSWPYMDPVAANVWKAMKPGTLLLYIGEDMGGCTADDEFFQLTEGREVEPEGFQAIYDNFVRFTGLHDRPVLFRK